MKVKLSTIFSPEVQGGFESITRAQMPIKTAYAVAKNLKKLDSKLKDINDKILELREKYGVKDDKGVYQVKPENLDVFNKEASEYLLQEVEVDIWKLSLSNLIACGVKLTPSQMMMMEDFIEDDTDSKT